MAFGLSSKKNFFNRTVQSFERTATEKDQIFVLKTTFHSFAWPILQAGVSEIDTLFVNKSRQHVGN